MQTTAVSSKHPRLVEIEQDFEKLERFLKKEPGIKETKRLKDIQACMQTFLSYQYGGLERCSKLYRLKQTLFFDKEIKEKLRQKMLDVLPFFKKPSAPTLFG